MATTDSADSQLEVRYLELDRECLLRAGNSIDAGMSTPFRLLIVYTNNPTPDTHFQNTHNVHIETDCLETRTLAR